MLSGGYLTVGRIRRIPLRVHIATPIGLFVFAGFSFNPILWAGILFIIIVHELGHTVLVKRFQLSVVSIDITGIGGVCRWQGHATEVQESIIAWGGVLAQGALLVLTEIVSRTVGLQGHTMVGQLATTLVAVNIYLMALNLLPFHPLDGAKAWALFRWRNIRGWGRRGALKVRATAIERELARLKQADKVPEPEPSQPRFLN